MSFKEFIKELSGNRVEGELIKTMFVSLVTSIIFLALVYIFKLKSIDGVLSKYGLYLILMTLSVSIITPAIQQIKAYYEFPCMSGMMIGMTVGMIASYVPGYFIGATNGLFVGSVFGMSIGITLGVWNGKCCGVMGAMEGIMAGFMGGLMGPMTAVMLLNDHLKVMAVIFFVIGTTIMFGLNYMIYNETRNAQAHRKNDQLLNMFITLIIMAIATWLMIAGPRSALFN